MAAEVLGYQSNYVTMLLLSCSSIYSALAATLSLGWIINKQPVSTGLS